MKLSRTGWNNVIIFVVMIFILVINATNKKLFSDDVDAGAEHLLLGKGSVILTLALNNITIERIGKTWRATPEKISGQGLEQMMMSWQQVVGNILTTPPVVDKKMALMIKINLAGQEQETVLNLYSVTDELLVFNHQTQLWFSLPEQIFQQLLPSQIFNN